ncbi:hypothetical protein [Phyllobacterium lublinensis]|uniref:hypothetical protein n=1 Tax=Phyllobacterium lublinensis TaxID=2875708 RepID=UPI001CCC3DDA|nr:hypothetical protein [Phyllobacterium sp. 2063]MBZ9657294.1 hypothetical protein [Phyllobacterium sp. 2063]
MAGNVGTLSALMKQVNGATDLARDEKQALLRDAARLIRTYNHLVAFSGISGEASDCDVASKLDHFADVIDFKYGSETQHIMREAADTIRFLGLMIGVKQVSDDVL